MPDSPIRPGAVGGMDYVMVWRLVRTPRLGLVPDIDVHDSGTRSR